MNTVAGTSNGAITLVDVDGLKVGTVGAETGLTSNNSKIDIQTGGLLNLAQNVDSGSADTKLVTTSGNINQTGGALTADGLEFNAAGKVTLDQAGNDMNTVAGTSNGAITLVDVDDLTIGAVGGETGLTSSNNLIDVKTGGDLTLANQTNAGTGDVNLNATAGAINSTGPDGVADVIGATLNLTAGLGGIGTTNVVEVTATTAINADTTADNSDIKIDSIGDAPLGVINAGTGALTLNSTGNITDTNDAVTGDYNGGLANIIAGGAILTSGTTGIGTAGNGIEMQLADFGGAAGDGRIEADGGSGGVYLTNDATTGFGLTIGSIGVLASGIVANGGAGDAIFVMSGSPLTVAADVLNTGGGNITLSALGSTAADTMAVNADIKATGGNGDVLLTAGDTITMAAGTTASAAGTGDVTLAAGEDYTDGVLDQDGNVGLGGGSINMAETATISSDNGNILLDAADDVIVGYANADGNNDGVRGDINVNARAGSVLDENTGVANTDPDFKANTVTVNAGQDIGAATDPIELDAVSFNATAGGDTFVNGIGDTIVNMTSAKGNINFETTGDVILGQAHAANGQVNLTAGHSILSQGGNATRVIANDAIRLTAGGVVGTITNAIHTQLNHAGTLFLKMGSQSGMVSANVTGNFTKASIQLLNNPPGLVLFNGAMIGGAPAPVLGGAISTLYANPNPVSLPQYAHFDGRYAADFPGTFNMDRFAVAPTTEIDTARIDMLPITGVTVPGVVPIPAPARPPVVVPIPAEAKPPVQLPTQEQPVTAFISPGKGEGAQTPSLPRGAQSLPGEQLYPPVMRPPQQVPIPAPAQQTSGGQIVPEKGANQEPPFYVSPLSRTIRQIREKVDSLRTPVQGNKTQSVQGTLSSSGPVSTEDRTR